MKKFSFVKPKRIVTPIHPDRLHSLAFFFPLFCGHSADLVTIIILVLEHP